MSEPDWPPGGTPGSLRLVRVRVPLVTPHRAAHGTEDVRDVILICWTRPDGISGWGECPTLSGAGYATETTQAAWDGLVSRLVPSVLAGSSVVVPGLVAASSAVMDAALDAELRAAGRSLVDELGGSGEALRRCVVLADLGATPGELAERAVVAVEGGASLVKVKIAPGHDLAVLRAVQDAVGVDRVAADANGSYGHPDELGALDGLGLVYLEQPFTPGTTWDELAGWRTAMSTPMALDESLVSLDAVGSAVFAGAADVISVKPARLGGVRAAATAVHLASERGIGAFVGGMLELGIGRAAAAAVASLPGCTLPTDLGPSASYVRTDVCDPMTVDGSGRLVLPGGCGIGRTPQEALLEQFAVEDLMLTG